MRTARDLGIPISFLRGAKRLRWSTIDRLLALALTTYEDIIDPSHGQRRDLAMDPDLADEWTHIDPVKDYAAEALALAVETRKEEKYPQAWRYVIGLKEGWESVRAARIAAREAAIDGG